MSGILFGFRHHRLVILQGQHLIRIIRLGREQGQGQRAGGFVDHHGKGKNRFFGGECAVPVAHDRDGEELGSFTRTPNLQQVQQFVPVGDDRVAGGMHGN